MIRSSSLDFAAAESAARRAVELDPGNAEVVIQHARFQSDLGRRDAALESAARAVQLDPLSVSTWTMQGMVLYFARRHGDAGKSFERALILQPKNRAASVWLALNELVSGNVDEAVTLCEADESWAGRQCLAIAYRKQGRQQEAAERLRQLIDELGDTAAYQYAEIYAQWGEPSRALEWLSKAVQLEDSGLWDLRANPLLDPIRATPRFKQIEEQLRFPP